MANGGSSDSVVAARAKYAKDVNAYVNDYIRFGDVKAGAVLTVVVAVVAAMGKALPAVLVAAKHSCPILVICVVLSVMASISAAVAILYCAFSLLPRVDSQPSLNSFPDIAKKTPKDYATEIAALTEADIVSNLSEHNVAISRVAMQKFGHISTAVKALVVLLFVAFAIVVLFVFASVA
jgi:hypothetical protein